MNTYRMITDHNDVDWVTIQPLMQDIEDNLEKLKKIDVTNLTQKDQELMNLKILGLHTVHNFLGSLVTEQFLKQQRNKNENAH